MHPDLQPDAALLRLVRQHAETSRLLGIDFVPRYRLGAAADAQAAPPLIMAAATPRPESQAPGPHGVPAELPTANAGRLPLPAGPVLGPKLQDPVLDLLTAPPRPAGSRPTSAADRQRALDDLRARYEADAPHKHFVTAHTNIVFGEGDPCARLMFIGEAPGEEEDKQGRPFVGRSGKLLEKMILAMGLSRERVYIANVLKTRPPDNATPTAKEAALCEPYLMEQIAIIAPEAIVTLGLPATRLLLKTTETMTRLRGTWAELVVDTALRVPVMPTYHPAFLLRSYTEENRAKVWSDLRQVMAKLGLKPAPGAPIG